MAALGEPGRERGSHLHVARLAPLELDEAQLDSALPLGPEVRGSPPLNASLAGS